MNDTGSTPATSPAENADTETAEQDVAAADARRNGEPGATEESDGSDQGAHPTGARQAAENQENDPPA